MASRSTSRPVSRTGYRRVFMRAGEHVPDFDRIVDREAIGSNTEAPIIVPQDWSGWGADTHPHAFADGARPDGWVMPPMMPAGDGGPRYFFDGASGAYPPPANPFAAWGFGYGSTDPTGYLDRLGVAMSATDLVSNVLASMPVYGLRGVSPFTLPDWRHNPEPERYESWVEFFAQLVTVLITRGECFLWATSRYADGYPRRFVILNNSWVGVSTDGFGGITYQLGDEPLRSDDVLHIRYASLPGQLHGIGPLEWMARSIVDGEVLAEYAANIARHGVPAILNSPQALDRPQAQDVKNAWMGSGRPGEPKVLSGGLSYEQSVGLSPESLAAADMLHITEAKIVSAIAATPPYLVGVEQPGGSMTYQSISMLGASWWRIGLRPLAQKIMSAMSEWLLPRGRVMELNRDEFIRPSDPAQLATYYSTMHGIQDPFGNPAITIDEIRTQERFVPHLDDASPGARPDVDLPERFVDSDSLSGGTP